MPPKSYGSLGELLAALEQSKSDNGYIMANANRCTVFPQHRMVNKGREESMFADKFVCECGEFEYGNTDELKERYGRQ